MSRHITTYPDDLPDEGSTDIRDAMLVKQSQWADLTALEQMPKVHLTGSLTEAEGSDEERNFEVTLTNESANIAFFVRASLVLDEGGNEVLPIIYSDNYVTLFPGESQTLQVQVGAELLGGAKPILEVEGYNVPKEAVA